MFVKGLLSLPSPGKDCLDIFFRVLHTWGFPRLPTLRKEHPGQHMGGSVSLSNLSGPRTEHVSSEFWWLYSTKYQGHNGGNDTRSIYVKSLSDVALAFLFSSTSVGFFFSSFTHSLNNKHKNGTLSYFWNWKQGLAHCCLNWTHNLKYALTLGCRWALRKRRVELWEE